MSYVAEVPLRWVDSDAQNHINNAIIVDYLQEARVSFLLSGPLAHLIGQGCLVAGLEVEFLRSIHFRIEPVEVTIQVGKVQAASFVLDYELRQDGQLAVRARTLMAIVDLSSGTPKRMAPADYAWLVANSVELEPMRDLGRWQVGEQAHNFDFAVRWSDLDTYGHMNNVRILDAIAEARVAMNPADSTKHRMQEAVDNGTMYVIARQDVDYLSPVYHRLEPYRMRTAFAKVGNTSITLAAQLEDQFADHQVLARSRTVLVYAGTSGRPQPVPPEIASGIELWPAIQLGS
jgi:acyl-CoA thioester hydrolase